MWRFVQAHQVPVWAGGGLRRLGPQRYPAQPAAGGPGARLSPGVILPADARSLYMNVPLAEKDRERWFAGLCEELRPELFRFAFWLARDRQVAEDVVQEALLRAWRSRNTLGSQDSAKQWLLTIVRREHARLYERKRLKTVQVDELVDEESPELAVAEEREVLDMRRAIMRLEDDYREPLVRQVLMGQTTQEIASQLGLTQGAVLTRLFRARQKLRRELGLAAGVDEP
jgi:RNA polymerase sigma-70 factor (ECF subfamily)